MAEHQGSPVAPKEEIFDHHQPMFDEAEVDGANAGPNGHLSISPSGCPSLSSDKKGHRCCAHESERSDQAGDTAAHHVKDGTRSTMPHQFIFEAVLGQELGDVDEEEVGQPKHWLIDHP